MIPAGHEIAWQQFQLPVRAPAVARDLAELPPLEVVEGSAGVRITSESVEVVFDPATGSLTSLRRAGLERLVSPPAPNFWRAPTDNDFGADLQLRSRVWRDAGVDRALEAFEVQRIADGIVRVVATWRLPETASSWRTTHLVYGTGAILFRHEFEPGDEDLPELPRLGSTMAVSEAFSEATWYGRGPHENYWDRRTGAALGRYELPVEALGHPYVRPQENGHRSDVRWLSLTDQAGRGLLVIGLPDFGFNAQFHLDADFDEGTEKRNRHTIDVIRRDFITLNIDHRQMGLGGDNSWGAVPHPAYTIRPRPISFQYLVLPVEPGDGDPASLAVTELYDPVQAGAASERPLFAPTFAEYNKVRHLGFERPVRVVTPASSPYSAAGDAGLTDGIRGSVDRRGGHWQGYEDAPLDAVVDLERTEGLSSVKIGFLRHPGTRVALPGRVEVLVSLDDENWRSVGEQRPETPADPLSPHRLFVEFELDDVQARYVRVVADGTNRDDGRSSWLYVDEIMIR